MVESLTEPSMNCAALTGTSCERNLTGKTSVDPRKSNYDSVAANKDPSDLLSGFLTLHNMRNVQDVGSSHEDIKAVVLIQVDGYPGQ